MLLILIVKCLFPVDMSLPSSTWISPKPRDFSYRTLYRLWAANVSGQGTAPWLTIVQTMLLMSNGMQQYSLFMLEMDVLKKGGEMVLSFRQM